MFVSEHSELVKIDYWLNEQENYKIRENVVSPVCQSDVKTLKPNNIRNVNTVDKINDWTERNQRSLGLSQKIEDHSQQNQHRVMPNAVPLATNSSPAAIDTLSSISLPPPKGPPMRNDRFLPKPLQLSNGRTGASKVDLDTSGNVSSASANESPVKSFCTSSSFNKDKQKEVEVPKQHFKKALETDW